MFSFWEIENELKAICIRFTKFAGVGVVGTLAHYITLIIAVQVLQLSAVVGSSFGAVIGALVNYFLNYRYTFNSSKKHHVAMSQFFMIAGIGFIINGLLIALLTEKYSIHYLMAQIITTGILLIWNFLGNQFWTFRAIGSPSQPFSDPPTNHKSESAFMNTQTSTPIFFQWKSDKVFHCILIFSAFYLFWGVWWGWPTSLDQHDPTRFAIKMLQHRSLDSGRRYYGAFGYQEVLLISIIPATIIKKIFTLDPHFAEALMFLITRILWATKALAIVVLTYCISKELFPNRRAALAAMLLVALSPGFIAWSHTPQLDIVQAFWFSLATALTAAGWNRSSLKLLWLAAVVAGLTASVKYLGGVIVLAPITALFLRFAFKTAAMYAVLFMVAALSVFFITTPLATGAPLEWLPEFTADVLYNSHRESNNPLALWTMPKTIWDMIGPGTSILGLVCLGISLFSATLKKTVSKQAIIIWLSCVVPYYLLLSWQHVATIHYLLPIAPMILVVIGVVLSNALENKKLVKFLLPLIAISGIVQLALTTSLIIGFSTDTRMVMASWLNEHTQADTQVETILNHRPFFSSEPPFKVINRPHFQAESYDMKRLVDADKDSSVRKLHNAFVKLARKDPEAIVTWVDRDREGLKRSADTFDTSTNGPATRHSKYILMNVNTAKHYIIDWPGYDPYSPNEKDFMLALLEERAPFKQVAEFVPVIPEWLRYPEELWFNLSPVIKIFEVVNPKQESQIEVDREMQ